MHRLGRFSRTLYLVAYALMVVAGCFVPVQLNYIPVDHFPFLWWIMTAWLICGGIISFFGQLRRRWTGEFIGLPLAASALGGFGLLQAGLADWSILSVPSVALLWSFAALTLSRWRDVQRLYKAARGLGR